MNSWYLPWFLPFAVLLVVSGLPTPENFDVDAGIEKDIFDINEELGLDLFEGDIKLDRAQERNSIIGDNYRWPHTIPYVLEDSLDMNAKGEILNAFERYRLKTCIDFKPWAGEPNYISVFKGSGCWSSVGNRHYGRQELSIGANCDRIATIQHEFLHALGFWHEQSRSDRDDYVNIMWDRIQSGREHNFNTYSDQESDSLNVPYDYNSVMHYSKTAFQNGSEPTIVTRIPDFMDVIGQRMDFSDYDLLKLNRLYNCTSSLSFMDTCDFELENVCGMIQSSEDSADWKRVSNVPQGPQSDHSNMGRCDGSGFFMHFDGSSVNVGATALLESRMMYPKRGFQCLQFYLYNSGSESDLLNIFVREYTTENVNGTLTLVEQIKDIPTGSWQLYHVTLKMTNKFRVVFGAVRGSGPSSGGLSVDDINLSETRCPHHIWHIKNITQATGNLESPPFYSSKGYAFQISLTLNHSTNVGIYFHLISGDNDDQLQWPCPWQQATMTLLDQNPDIQQRMSNQRSITTDPLMIADNGGYFWDRPSKVGTVVLFPNGTQYHRGPGFGTSAFITHERLKSRDFIKGNDVYILLTVEDISHLNSTQTEPVPPPVSTVDPPVVNGDSCTNVICENKGICIVYNNKAECRCPSGVDWWYTGERCEKRGSTRDTIVIATSSTVTVFAVMLIITLVSVYCVRKKYRQRLRDNTAPRTLPDVSIRHLLIKHLLMKVYGEVRYFECVV
ncbi:PREDICTED: meprin A subunit beta [Elephantulus edwardii]|uniref:meprin A subunit beta n=1 Tax=Elephantulus edwardii TaxID=28737 RepID=UPI0003F0EA63|nr:PREDICTED: meprin A subunit beta [Elephantulus edwardii]